MVWDEELSFQLWLLLSLLYLMNVVVTVFDAVDTGTRSRVLVCID